MSWRETSTSDAFIENFDSVSRGANGLLVVKPVLVTAVLVLFVIAGVTVNLLVVARVAAVELLVLIVVGLLAGRAGDALLAVLGLVSRDSGDSGSKVISESNARGFTCGG